MAHQAITHAIEILKLEREIRPNVLHNDTRFQYELCCINVAAYMFEKFLNDKPNFYVRLTPNQIQTALLKILESTHEIDQQHSLGICPSFYCRLLTTFFIVELTQLHDVGEPFPQKLLPYLQKFRDLFKDENRANPTTLTKIIFLIVDWWGETDANIKKVKREIGLNDISKSRSALKEGVSMPYEFKRHSYFEQFLV